MKKVISLILVLAVVFGILSPTVCFAEDSDYPVIMIEGRNVEKPIYNAAGERIYPVDISDEYIVNAVEQCLPYLGKGLITGDLKPWAKKVAEFIAPIYKDVIPDKNGNITDGSHGNNPSGADSPLYGWGNGVEYVFNYDWRRDPFNVADLLQDYIFNIMDKTGCEKVSLAGRCYGGSIIEAYLAKYGHEYIDTVVFYCASQKGCFSAGKAFSGQFELDPRKIEAYLDGGDIVRNLFTDPVIEELVKSTMAFLNSFYGLDAPTGFIADLVNNVLYPALAPEVMPVCFGAYPSYWAMCNSDSFVKARGLIYGDKEEEYAQFLEKIDAYHEVQINLEDMLSRYVDEGMNIAFVVKYNSKVPPFFTDSNVQSDDTVEVGAASLGATAAKFGEVLSDEYIKSVDGKYISSDRIIDASTCLFPEYTWFIKDLTHSNFSGKVDRMMSKICKYDGQATTETFEEYPRFIKYVTSNDTLVPLADEPENQSSVKFSLIDIFRTFIRWIKAVFTFINSRSQTDVTD